MSQFHEGEAMDYSLLTRLTEAAGISGREERVRDIVAGEFTRLGLESRTDALGNLVAHRPGAGPRLALVAHLDEVGFMVSRIDEQGFVRVIPVGGVDPQVFVAQRVTVHGRRDLTGVVGSVPPHLRKKDAKEAPGVPPVAEGFIDLGLPVDTVRERVAVGDPVTFATRSWENEVSYFGKALDDRLGLFVMLTALERAQTVDCDLVLVASAQEEYGLRGVGPALFQAAPRIAVALEGTVASDTPGLTLPANVSPIEQGRGPEIRLSDGRMLADRRLADFLAALAREKGIEHQVVVKNTGATDAAAGQLVAGGIVVGAVSVPTRYIHAPVAVARKSDIEQTTALVTALLEATSRFAA